MTDQMLATYRALLMGELSDRQRERVRRELQIEESEMSTWLRSVDPQQLERDLERAYRGALPQGQRQEALSRGEQGALFDHIEDEVRGEEKSPLTSQEAEALFDRVTVETAGATPRPEAERRPPGTWWRVFRLAVPSFALGAAATMLFMSVRQDPSAESSSRTKGAEQQVTPRIRLMFNVVHREAGRPLVIDRGEPGASYPSSAQLLLRYQLTQAGYVCLLHHGPGGAREILFAAADLLPPGWHDLRYEGQVQGLDLGDDLGRNTFYAYWTRGRLDCAELLRQVTTGQTTVGALVDSLEVEVRR